MYNLVLVLVYVHACLGEVFVLHVAKSRASSSACTPVTSISLKAFADFTYIISIMSCLLISINAVYTIIVWCAWPSPTLYLGLHLVIELNYIHLVLPRIVKLYC